MWPGFVGDLTPSAVCCGLDLGSNVGEQVTALITQRLALIEEQSGFIRATCGRGRFWWWRVAREQSLSLADLLDKTRTAFDEDHGKTILAFNDEATEHQICLRR
jgi:hypothetical protein